MSAWRKGNWSLWLMHFILCLMGENRLWYYCSDCQEWWWGRPFFLISSLSLYAYYTQQRQQHPMGGPVLVDALRIPPVAISPHADLAETPRGWELNSTGLTLGGPTLSSLGPHDIPRAMGVLKSGEVPKGASSYAGQGRRTFDWATWGSVCWR